MAAVLGQGSLLGRSEFAYTNADPSVESGGTSFTNIVGITAMTIVSGLPEELEVTDLGRAISSGRNYINGFQEDASINISFQFDGGVTTHQALLADQANQPLADARSTSVGKSARNWRITIPKTGGNTTITFRAFVRNLTVNQASSTVQSASFDLVLREAPVFA